MNKNVKKALAAAGVLAVLALAFWYGGSAPGLQGWSPAPGSSNGAVSSAPAEQPVESGDSAASEQEAPEQTSPAPQPEVSEQTPDVSPQENPAPDQSQPAPTPEPEPQPQEEEPALTCTLSIRCGAILDNWDWLDPDKAELVPADGVILAPEEVPFEEGETVFDLLRRQTRAHGIHMEATFTPGYGSSYVEGIANLYEFDCGQQSGWVYLVNGVSPGYGSSQYVLSDGDVVEWAYTCDLGHDVGGAP